MFFLFMVISFGLSFIPRMVEYTGRVEIQGFYILPGRLDGFQVIDDRSGQEVPLPLHKPFPDNRRCLERFLLHDAILIWKCKNSPERPSTSWAGMTFYFAGMTLSPSVAVLARSHAGRFLEHRHKIRDILDTAPICHFLHRQRVIPEQVFRHLHSHADDIIRRCQAGNRLHLPVQLGPGDTELPGQCA